ncbi:hypothetical protein [Bittarella massiliensis (ex Durand et al. 2017)]|uniref:TM2 domain-containing protein n=1 Tax=Bittarella massiliensis (ex Durand et al. 2017) TaxID=1720313 RepID=A0AAW5KCN4_9FIRM|nr:hypothetical protein [Bittarella massiliensis (ex Durand et al. 2017)]MCQ4949672.1 hypothetical protein [Bittarella massiliensis (ex Durand et al. 2017)]
MRKSKFLTFFWSLLPGAGQMYLGLMRRGVSLMALFFGAIAVAGWLNIGLFLFAIPVIWFYAFFDAMNLGNLPYDALQYRRACDDFLWKPSDMEGLKKRLGGKTQIWVGLGCIALGLYVLLDNLLMPYLRRVLAHSGLFWDVVNSLPTLVVALAVIALGFYLVIGRNRREKEIPFVPYQGEEESEHDGE